MRKIYCFIFGILLLAGCTADNGDDYSPDIDDPAVEAESSCKVSYKDAVANLFAVLEVLDSENAGVTRSYQPPRMIRESKALRLAPMQTRSGNPMPDTLLFVVNFEDSGYAIISADTRVKPVLAVTDNACNPAGQLLERSGRRRQ